MEILLAMAVIAAVVFFGALISLGNERQRKAIDGLREQTILWAMQDLKIKRERLAHDVQVDDPIAWLNKVTAKVCGYNPDLQVLETFSRPPALVCTMGEGTNKFIFSPLSPDEVRKRHRDHRNRLAHYAGGNPLLSLPHKVTVSKFTALTHGFLFDLELPLAWSGLTGQESDQMECLWMYVI